MKISESHLPTQCAADYRGQGYLKFATFRNGLWIVSARPNITLKFGQKGDVPIPLDFENVLGESFAVFRPAEVGFPLEST